MNFYAIYPSGGGSGGGGGGGSVVWFNEQAAGVSNNSNTAFTISNVPADAATFQLYLGGSSPLDGTLLQPGVDYTLVGVDITMTIPPNFGQKLYAYYRKT